MRTVLLGLLLVAAVPASALEQIGGDAFEALVEGRSLGWFPLGGSEPYGVELYYPGRRVMWFHKRRGECAEGTWEQAGPANDPAICFLYEGRADPVCWETWYDGKTQLGAINLEVGEMITVDLGSEHDVPFGCDYLGS